VCAPAGFYYNYVTHSDELRLLPSNIRSSRHVPIQQKSPQAKFNTCNILMTLAKEMVIVLNCQSVTAEIKSSILVQSDHTFAKWVSWFRIKITKNLGCNFLQILFYSVRTQGSET
jgi:hypothetical protein